MKIVNKNQPKIVIFTAVKNRSMLHGRVLVMSFVYIGAKVCQVLLHYILFATRRQKCVQENWPKTK